ncbi:response regulator transcription factor [Microbacterium sp.]|uniref:response regulator transcription factor n=1 Tax=Microbacterium sp. TaxID=51671 RepID=UPI00289E44A8|nr:response regulator transcription factor [Microbacterium sp.]
MSDDAGESKTAVVIEDDPDVRHMLADVLEAAGFSTISVGNGLDGVRAVETYQPLITTLDVNLPGIDGFEAARRIRQRSDTYIIMLTGQGEEADAVLGLAAGADDFVTKPFRPRELRARIEAMLRRPRSGFPGAAGGGAGAGYGGAGQVAPGAGRPGERPLPVQDRVGPSFPTRTVSPETASINAIAAAAADALSGGPASEDLLVLSGPLQGSSDPESWLTHRDLQLDPETRIARIGERELELTRTEFDLLAALLESKRRVRSKADLALVLRGESYVTTYYVGDADKRAIEAHMTNLRRKLGDDPTNPRYIETVRGVGYRLTSEH